MAKLKTPEQAEKIRNARLLRTYGRTAEEYDVMLADQNQGCKICGSDGGKRSLHVDHDHKYKYVRIEYYKDKIWFGAVVYRGVPFAAVGVTKSEVRTQILAVLKRNSTRGLLCWPCNKLLRAAFDQPERLSNAAKYLETFNAPSGHNQGE